MSAVEEVQEGVTVDTLSPRCISRFSRVFPFFLAHYQYRAKRNGTKPSTHSWGIAIDFNVGTNAMGTAGDMDPRLGALMEGLGFLWGGRWSGRGKDPMHFQYCSAY